MQTILEDNAVVLFQGDSITDAGRSRLNDEDLGRGYAAMAAAWFQALYPERGVRFLNRGISGNRVKDLRARWKIDCLDLNPTWVSIMIGINDTWRRYDSSDPTSTQDYEQDFHFICTQVMVKLNARLIIMEPFLLPIPPDRVNWRVDLDPKIAAARRMAREFNAIFMPLDGVFASAATRQSMEYWLPDGVHPTAAAHALIAQTWLKYIKAI
ncbi:MAG: SGNH/GDSL hydrolase family protein [Anaerolineae bacterium]|nr:SGNH/GDSL hydrolase family protein [Anaerolineae bacterium]